MGQDKMFPAVRGLRWKQWLEEGLGVFVAGGAEWPWVWVPAVRNRGGGVGRSIGEGVRGRELVREGGRDRKGREMAVLRG